MATFLIAATIIMLVLGLVGYLSGRRSDHMSPDGQMLSLLSGGTLSTRAQAGGFASTSPSRRRSLSASSDAGALALHLGNSFNLGARTECLCDVAEGRLLGVAYLHASDPEEASFRGSLGYFLADAAQPSLEGRSITGCLGCKNRRNFTQIFE